MVKPSTNWLTQVADTKYVGYGEKAAFKVRQEGIRAFIQAKGATPARSKIAHKQVTLDTIAVSARPVINTYELKTGRVQMADLIRDAANEMSQKEIEHIQTVLHAAATNWSTPFYGTGSGVVKTVLNPMIQHWMRTGAVCRTGNSFERNEVSVHDGAETAGGGAEAAHRMAGRARSADGGGLSGNRPSGDSPAVCDDRTLGAVRWRSRRRKSKSGVGTASST